MRLLSFSCLVFVLAVSTCKGQNNDRSQAGILSVSASAVSVDTKHDDSTTATEQKSTMSQIRSVDESIRKKLNEPCNFNFDQTPWSEIEEQLEIQYKFNIVLTSSAKYDSLTDDEPITENLAGIPLRHALRIMLQKKNATFNVQDGVMKIISLDDADDANRFSTMFYNVRPLLANISELEKNRIGKPRIAPQANQSEYKIMELVTTESLLTDLIHSTFRPDEWQHTGQGLATINIIGGIAVVSCNEEFADELRDFLNDLDYHIGQN